eukprot:453075_1
MRFGALIQQPDLMIYALTAISKLTHEALIILSPTTRKIMINENFVSRGHPQCYASIPITNIFDKYKIESQANNEILLQMNISNLISAFSSVQEFNGSLT